MANGKEGYFVENLKRGLFFLKNSKIGSGLKEALPKTWLHRKILAFPLAICKAVYQFIHWTNI